jgi:hypothetical protein
MKTGVLTTETIAVAECGHEDMLLRDSHWREKGKGSAEI